MDHNHEHCWHVNSCNVSTGYGGQDTYVETRSICCWCGMAKVETSRINIDQRSDSHGPHAGPFTIQQTFANR